MTQHASLVMFVVLMIWSCNGKNASGPETAISPDQILHNELTNLAEAHAIPGFSAAIVRDGNLLWQDHIGLRDIAQELVPDAETVYMLASISKTIVAVAAMQLLERGQLGLDSDINTYLPFSIRNPHFPDVPITAHMLLTHTSGLAWPNGEDPQFYRTYRHDNAPALGTWLREYLRPQGSQYVAAIWKNTRPGTNVSYSNIGAALMGYVVEAITGQDFASYCKQNIFNVLQMENTGFRYSDIVEKDKLSTLYTSSTSTAEQYSVRFYPSTTVRSSVAAFARFASAIAGDGSHAGNRILQSATLERMLEPKFGTTGIGYLWWLNAGWHGHTGGFAGVSSTLSTNRQHGISIIVFGNMGGKNALYPGGEIYAKIIGRAQRYMGE